MTRSRPNPAGPGPGLGRPDPGRARGFRTRRRPTGLAVLLLSGLTVGCGSDLDSRNAAASEAYRETGGQTTSLPPSPPADSTTPPGAPGGETTRVDLSLLGFDRGESDAPIRIIEFSDFGCGYCRRFNLETYPTLHEEYVETGKVEWKYVPYVLGIFPNGVEAALAGECAGRQDGFEAMHHRLFEDQREWKSADEPNPLFVRYAREEGLDAEAFGRCLEEGTTRPRVTLNIQAGAQLGIRGTPTFFIPGYAPLQGALPVDLFRQIFDMLLAEKERNGA